MMTAMMVVLDVISRKKGENERGNMHCKLCKWNETGCEMRWMGWILGFEGGIPHT